MSPQITDEARGQLIVELRTKQGWTQEMLAESLGVDVRTVRRWEGGRQSIRSRNLAALASALQAPLELLVTGQDTSAAAPAAATTRVEDRDLRTVDLVVWLADAAQQPFAETYELVVDEAGQLESESPSRRYERDLGRASISRQDLADAVADYYDLADLGVGVEFYQTVVAGRELSLTIVVDGAWRALDIDLRGEEAQGALASLPSPAGEPLAEPVHRAAVARLADAEANDRVLINNPMYRLLSADVASDRLDLSFTLATFADYALRNGLMEMETVDALRHSETGRLSASSPTPVRDSLLPSARAAFDLSSYFCTGGVVALFAAARPAVGGRPADYVLLIQQRGQNVMDIPGKLSTVPKGWHQPIGEAATEVRLGTTLLREFEEELLGRQDLEQMSDEARRTADPLHRERHPAAMLELLSNPGSFHLRCTGFGLNLLSGTYEVPCLIVIDDEDWWGRWGHLIAGNWETMSIDSISSADTDRLAVLIHDPRWSNEGLFALLEGLRCLDHHDAAGRVALPSIR